MQVEVARFATPQGAVLDRDHPRAQQALVLVAGRLGRVEELQHAFAIAPENWILLGAIGIMAEAHMRAPSLRAGRQRRAIDRNIGLAFKRAADPQASKRAIVEMFEEGGDRKSTSLNSRL